MKVLITGSAGFIGYHLAQNLLRQSIDVIGLDNVSDYYNPSLKEARLTKLGGYPGFTFHRFDMADKDRVAALFKKERPTHVVNLAAQAGVRYSLEQPFTYTHSNIEGFLSILEACRAFPVEHLVFASTSSIYGATKDMPYREEKGAEHPLTLYAATKKADEMMAHNYAHLFNIPCTAVRFFTVYGPWGRPDMALFIFTRAIMENRPLPLFNGGNLKRDFTFVGDVAEGLTRLLPLPPSIDSSWDPKIANPSSSGVAPYRVLNLGRGKSEPLMRFVEVLEDKLGKKAEIDALPMQSGDVEETWADTTRMRELTGFEPKTDIDEGVGRFVDWYLDYYNINR